MRLSRTLQLLLGLCTWARQGLAQLQSQDQIQFVLPRLYTEDQDLASQRTALESLFQSADGPNWVFPYQYGDSATIPQYAPAELLEYFGDPNLTTSEAEQRLLGGIYGPSGLPAQYRLGLWSIGLAKVPWFTSNSSYCTWAGVTCCMTGDELALSFCRYGMQSVAWLSLSASNLTGVIPSEIFYALPDLQFILLADNPGLTGPFPALPTALAKIMQVFDISFTNFSQPCSLNSQLYGGNNESITIGSIGDISQYSSCLPNFLAFDENVLHKTTYNDVYLCPAVRWNRALPDDGTLDAPDLIIPRSHYLPSLINSDNNGSFVEKFDPRLYSFAGCACIDPDYQAVTKVDAHGNRYLESVLIPKSPLWHMLAIILSVVVASLFMAGALLVWQFPRLHREFATWQLQRLKARAAPGTLSQRFCASHGLIFQEVTLVMTDVQGSTELWECFPGDMAKALDMHDNLVRKVLKLFSGHEVTTEGDAFILAFHEALDAINFCVNLQQALLEVPWPENILSNKHAQIEYGHDGKTLFKGLRIRAAVHTGIPAAIEIHDETGQMEYTGEMVDLTEAVSRLPTGGQILMSGETFQRFFTRRAAPASTERCRQASGSKKSSGFLAAATPGQKTIFIDQGRFAFTEFVVPTGLNDDGLAVVGGFHIVEVSPSELACRSLSFPALDPALKIAPSFFNAPGASVAELPGRKPEEICSIDITIVFCSCCQMKPLLAMNAEVAKAALCKFKSCLRTMLRLADGYECQEKDGVFMLAFEGPKMAAEWAILFNMALLDLEWPDELLMCGPSKIVLDSKGDVLLAGISAAIGMVHGPMVTVCPHKSTGKADYFGSTVNRAARVWAAAQDGQVLLDEADALEVARQWASTTGGVSSKSKIASRNFHLLRQMARNQHADGQLNALHASIGSSPAREAHLHNRSQAAGRTKSIVTNIQDEPLVVSNPYILMGHVERKASFLSANPAAKLQKSLEGGRHALGRLKHHAERDAAPEQNVLPGNSSVMHTNGSPESEQAGAASATSGPHVDGLHEATAQPRSMIKQNSRLMSTFMSAPSEQSLKAGLRSLQDSLAAPHPPEPAFLHYNPEASGKSLQHQISSFGLRQTFSIAAGAHSFSHPGKVRAAPPSRTTSTPAKSLSLTKADALSEDSIDVPLDGERRPSLKQSLGSSPSAMQHLLSQAGMPRAVSMPIDDSMGIPQKLVDVDVYSLGLFAFKGLASHRQIAQLIPTSLSERLALFPHVLKRGKATCITADSKLLATSTAILPDVSGLVLAR
ncbi:hypothetical protein WJX84_005112 [Apatococcus fuscideae]|uniref:Guanylate cyclase domain-containing protein n=1 Tax=Apatococcus fuscideae TaxID=2026836 RepID=A0AAW1T3Z4_9CHLO